jgi:hypothetical protein
MLPGTVILRRTNMIRRMIPLVVAIVLVVGCKKSGTTTAPTGEEGGGDPNATYTIKIREEQKGDKTEVSETQTGTAEINFGGKGEKEKQDKKYTYTQEILEMPAGEKPTKLVRKYTVAQKFDKATNALKVTPLEGKTVNIEMKVNAKKEKYYDFTAADGKWLEFEINDLRKDFSNADKKSKKGIEELLPKNPVKIGEPWNIDPAALESLGGGDSFPIDAAKSKMTGKLTKVYTKDGKQWGVIAFDLDVVLDPNAKKGKGSASGTFKVNGTFDAVIDGSSQDGTLKLNMKMDVTGKEDDFELKMSGDVVEEKTVKSLK